MNFLVEGDSLFVCGAFDSIGGIGANGVAMYFNNQWHSLNLPDDYPPSVGNFARRMMFYKGSLYLTGYFYDSTGTQRRLRRWDGNQWYYIDPDIAGSLSFTGAMAVYNDMLIVAGAFQKSTGNADNNIQAWDGNQWHEMGGGTGGSNATIEDLRVYNGKLYAVGTFTSAGGIPASRIAIWDGAKWCGLNGVFDDKILTLDFCHDTLYVAGGFEDIDGHPAKFIAKYLGNSSIDTCSVSSNINEIPSNSFFLSPNPASTQINIVYSITQTSTLTITDAYGRVVKQLTLYPYFKNRIVYLEGLAQGVYLVSLQADGKMVSEKLVVE